jgi:hypothetical protein
VSTGQPYGFRFIALQLLLFVSAVLSLSACGSTSVTDITAPGGVRCEASITAEPSALIADATSTTLTISAARDCAWSARSEASWLQLASTSGQGASTIAVTVGSNAQAASRSGNIVVNDQRLTLTQEGRGCTITLSGPTTPMPVAGGRATMQVSTLAGCPWTVTSSAPWLTPLTTSGSGAGNVAYDVSANTGAIREASLTVAGRTFIVSQDAAPTAPPCSFSINPTSRDVPATGGRVSVSVTAQAGCAWSATGGTSWVTLDTTSGTGSATADYTVLPNPTISARQTTLTIAGRVHTVNQAGLVCSFTLTPGARSFSATGGDGSITVDTLPICPWTATTNAGWVTLTTPSGTGPGPLSYRVLTNTTTLSRSATITVGGQTHTITQSGAAPPCSYALAPSSRTVAATGATATVTLTTTAGCAWTAVSSEGWLSVASTSAGGTGPAEITYTAAANTATSSRTATITVAGEVHTVTQSAATPACTYDVAPPSRTVASTGITATVALTTAPGCPWTAVSSQTWLTIAMGSAGGSGPADITYTVAPNTTSSSRTATVTVGGRTHTVTQDAPPVTCTYSLSPASREFQPAGGSGTVTLTTGPTCPWTAVSSDTWLMVTNTGGTGSATINYVVAAGSMSVDRTATITVQGQVHTVRQRRTP